MSVWVCSGCTAAYAVGLPSCPQCSSTEYEENGMPKITRAAGASDASLPEPQEDAQEPQTEQPEAQAADAENVPQEATEGQGDGYAAKTKVELQQELDQRGLPKAGNKDDLVARLEEHDAQPADEQAPAEPAAPAAE